MARFVAQDCQVAPQVDRSFYVNDVLLMKRQTAFSWVLLAGLAACALLLSGCSTVRSRIEENQAGFARLSQSDQALVTQGKIRGGMSQDAVFFAWGRPQQKAVGEIHGVPTETWVYLIATTVPSYGYGWRLLRRVCRPGRILTDGMEAVDITGRFTIRSTIRFIIHSPRRSRSR